MKKEDINSLLSMPDSLNDGSRVFKFATWEPRVSVEHPGIVKFSAEGFVEIRKANIKTKRLMTPAECAGKWTCKDGERVLVCGYRGDHITTAYAVTSTVKELHERGWMIADTPTSEPRSMEIES